MPQISGKVKRVTYRNAENGFTVLKVFPNEAHKQELFDKQTTQTNDEDYETVVTVVGVMPGLEADDEVTFEGSWDSHPKYGENFKVTRFHVQTPTSLEGLERFLASNHIKGVGEGFAKQIVARFGEKTTEILENEPEKLAQIKGITQQKALDIGKQWQDALAQREQIIELQGIGATPLLASKIVDMYGQDAVSILKQNPYQLATDIWGVGFKTSDELAQNLGFEYAHPYRIQAGVRYALVQAMENGHLYLPHDKLLEETSQLIQVNVNDIAKQIRNMTQDGSLVEEKEAIFLHAFFNAETSLARHINRIEFRDPNSGPMKVFSSRSFNWEKVFDEFAKSSGFSLNVGQTQAIQTTFTSPFSVLTGGPGTGKSTAVNAVVYLANKYRINLTLVAPTGRAAKRLTELTNHPASTIHRLLKIKPGSFPQYDEDNPLPTDLLVVDEASMLDVLLAEQLFSAVGKGTHVLLVGDSDQLPSVQAGNVLRDIVESNTAPVTPLTEIFRQAQESAIVRNAHKINKGRFPSFPDHPTDFYLFEEQDMEQAGARVIELMTERIPKQFGFDPLEEIQILTPMYKTAAGVSRLNAELQRVLNPIRTSSPSEPSGFRKVAEGRFRVGDRVMQLSNNYEKEVFNGEVGRIMGVSNQELVIRFDEKEVTYKSNELDQVTLA